VQDADDYRALGELMRNASAPRQRPLLERALAVFARRWNEFAERERARGIPGDLAVVAADAYAELGLLHPQLRKPDEPPWPAPLLGLERARLSERWQLDRDLLDRAADECRLASPAEEAEAERLWQEYARAVNDGRKAEALAHLDSLLGSLRFTSRVRGHRKELVARRDQLAELPKLATQAEEKAARSLVTRAESTRVPAEALALLDELLATYAHTDYVTSEKRFLTSWRDKLRGASGK
jgi:hypothetical protein